MKRNLFAELTEGFDALKAERKGKRTLRTHAVERKRAKKQCARVKRNVKVSMNQAIYSDL